MKPAWASRAKGRGRSAGEPEWVSRSKRSLSQNSGLVNRLPSPLATKTLQRAWKWSDLEPKLRAASLPTWWIEWVLAAAAVAATLDVISGVEVFSGVGNLSTAFGNLVGPAETFDVAQDRSQEILHVNGVRQLLVKIMRIMHCGWLWLGTPCSSWIVLTRSFTRRSLLLPGGPRLARRLPDSARTWASTMASQDLQRCCSKRRMSFPYIQWLSNLDLHSCTTTHQWRKCCNKLAWSMLLSICLPSAGLRRNLSSSKVLAISCGSSKLCAIFAKVQAMGKSRLTTQSGKRFTGRRADLAQSSSYTRTFGLAMAMCFTGMRATEVCGRLDAMGL